MKMKIASLISQRLLVDFVVGFDVLSGVRVVNKSLLTVGDGAVIRFLA